MKEVIRPYVPEHSPRATIHPPVSEQLYVPDFIEQILGDQEAISQKLKSKITERANLSHKVINVLDKLEDPVQPIEAAYAEGYVTSQDIDDLYAALADLLAEPDNARLILYLPSELLPDRSWSRYSPEVSNQIEPFISRYKATWQSLLTVHDAKANFIDGDVMETDQREGDIPRVVKATHLIPTLLQKQILNPDEVISIYESSPDPLLRHNIKEALAASTESKNDVLEALKDPATYLNATVTDITEAIYNQPATETQPQPQFDINDLHDLDITISQTPIADYQAASVNRKAWLEFVREEEIINAVSASLAALFMQRSVEPGMLQALQSTQPENQQIVIIRAIQTCLENSRSLSSAKEMYKTFAPLLDSLTKSEDSPRLTAAVSQMYRRLHHAQIVSAKAIQDMEIDIPQLAGPVSHNLALLRSDTDYIKAVSERVASDQRLRDLAYPVIMLYGSRLKGYGEPSSDLDIGVFIKDGVQPEQAHDVRRLIAIAMGERAVGNMPVEFWLNEDDNQITIKQVSDQQAVTGDEFWTHMFFGSAWIGKAATVNRLQAKLLPSYFAAGEASIRHRYHLESLERDLLQYRLLHKGYRRHYPERRGTYTPPSGALDNNGVYYDPGYRTVATKLFLKNVFLPQV